MMNYNSSSCCLSLESAATAAAGAAAQLNLLLLLLNIKTKLTQASSCRRGRFRSFLICSLVLHTNERATKANERTLFANFIYICKPLSGHRPLLVHLFVSS